MQTEKLVQPQVHAATLPVDVRGGVHFDLLAPGTVTFVMHAPFKPYVSLVGDFNRWNTRAHPMVTNGRGTWWITLPHPGQTRYGFYVAIDEQAHSWVGDPYATQVAWTSDGPWAVLPERPTPFPWTDQAWRTPRLQDLVIYELCVRDFAGRWQGNRPRYGNFQELLKSVPYLAELGVNAVELMPIQAFPGESSWGYNPVFYFAVANVYGGPNDLKAFVDACHRHGLAVILDVAFNHAWGQHPYYQIYPPMYGPHGEELTDWNPFFHHTPRAVNMWGGVDWDHFNEHTTRYFQDVVRFWLQEYHVDGFRFDWVCGVDYDSRDPMAPGFNPFHGISAICWAARQAKPDCILIGEYWQLEGTHPEKTAAKLVAETPMDACWRGEFHHGLDDVLNQRWAWEKRDIFRAIGGFREEGFTAATQVVNYSCSHDEVRPEHEIKFYSWPHIRRPAGMSLQELALRKGLLGLITLLAAPGIPMIYAGQEYGEDTPRTIDFCPLEWHKLERPAHAAHRAVVQRLLWARRSLAALRSDFIQFWPDNFAETGVVRFVRWDDEGNFVVVALNFGEEPRTVSCSMPHDGHWMDLVAERSYEAVQGELTLSLEPWQGMMLIPTPGP
ncbi:hypothetical protein FKZ61_002985 [Litorilinea aerophila]|uniref:Glycosyl hydrolase family 13 catalytic domain-containing protein n=1 Tax=Litorilinea aerophila TaxID=1204385 RepID=A0A540VKW0_9CHLR|nr:alpha-amylase family glycosyl hydrolase [Litorilinea aerophila]MCC9075078.1 hypothetical protein [Litorilinea aerophila]